jgi:hypothetical protein
MEEACLALCGSLRMREALYVWRRSTSLPINLPSHVFNASPHRVLSFHRGVLRLQVPERSSAISLSRHSTLIYSRCLVLKSAITECRLTVISRDE